MDPNPWFSHKEEADDLDFSEDAEEIEED